MTSPAGPEATDLAARVRHHWLVLGVAFVGGLWIVVSWAFQHLVAHDGPREPGHYLSDIAGLVTLLVVIALAERRTRRITRRLAEHDSQLTQLLDHSPDAIVILRDGIVVFANEASARLMRAPGPSWFLGRNVADLLHPDDLLRQVENLAGLVPGEPAMVEPCRLIRADGTVMEADVAGAAVRYEGGIAIQVVTRDVSDRRALERAREASEQRLRDLLDSVGLLAMTVDEDGRVVFANRVTHELAGVASGALLGRSAFELLWFPDEAVARTALREAFDGGEIVPQAELDFVPDDGRRRTVRWHLALLRDEHGRSTGVAAIGEDVTDARAANDRLGALLAAAPVGICAVDSAGRVRFAAGGPFERVVDAPESSGDHAWEHLDDLPAAIAGLLAHGLAGDATEALLDLEGRLFEAAVRHVDGAQAGAIVTLVEVTERARLERDRARLATAIDQASDAIVITDREGRITYVNPAFERVTGYSQAEALGSTPRILKSGVQGPAFYEAMWETLLAGRPWTGELVNRAKDGSEFREEVTITPVRDDAGAIVNFVAVKRDVTRLRSLEDALEIEVRERATIVAALEHIDRTGPLHEIADAIAQEMKRVPGVDSATVYLFDREDAVPIATTGPRTLPIELERPIPASRSAYLRKRATGGAWAEPIRILPEDGPFGERLAQAGLAGAAYVPLRVDDRIRGLLVLATTRRTDVDGLTQRLPSLVALGTVASSLLADGVRARDATTGERRSIEELIAHRRFAPVYQPVVDVRTGEALGFEALTRFTNGDRPDVVFRRAAEAGLGPALEVATLRAAIDGAAALPADAFLGLNVSPALIASTDRLARVLADVRRPIVLEITEHAEIEDYVALREATRRLPAPVRLAVDDAGAGFASLRHVLELAPDIVKVDRSIVTRIDGDPARQALVAGLRFFASRRGIQLIAEGVETPAELAALTALSVPMAQGFLLGAPLPAAEATAASGVFAGLGVPAVAEVRLVTRANGGGAGGRNGNGQRPVPSGLSPARDATGRPASFPDPR